MNLIIDIGNSSAKVAFFQGGQMQETLRVGLAELEDFVATEERMDRVERCIVSSTVMLSPSLLDKLRAVDSHAVVLSGMTPLPFAIDYKTPHTLGPDRVAAVAGAMSRWQEQSILVVDAGTCVTYDVLTCKNTACGAPTSMAHYVGGNIAPGLMMRLRAVNEHTSRLPLVDPRGELPQLGFDTHSAIRAGVLRGIQHEIEGYIDYINKEYGRVKVVLTGGDSLQLKSLLADDVVVDEHLVLYGLDYILQYNEQIS